MIVAESSVGLRTPIAEEANRATDAGRGHDRALFVATDNPFPPDSGGRLRTRGILDVVSRRFSVDLVTYERPGNPDIEEARSRLNIVEVPRTVTPRSAALRSLYLMRNCSYMSHADVDMAATVADLCRTRTYQLVFIVNTMLGHVIPSIKQMQPDARFVTVSENFETDLCLQIARAQTKIGRRLFFLFSAFHTRRYEKQLCRLTDLMLATSEDEAASFAQLSPGVATKIVVIPSFINADSYEPYSHRPRLPASIIFLGNLSFFPNVTGAVYFYREIYPALKASCPDLTWYVAGKNCHPSILESVKGDPSVVVTGYVPDVADCISRSAVMVVPLLHGSGTRLKILEAWAVGRPVVSTSKGCEGLDCQHNHNIVIADTPAAFVAGVTRLLRDPDFAATIAQNARHTLLASYDARAVEPRLLASFDTLSRS
jgi:glycosyltransferase involved in cell wall biosynthesis